MRKIGKLKQAIVQFAGRQYFTQFGITMDFWKEAMSSRGFLRVILTSLYFCIDAAKKKSLNGSHENYVMKIEDATRKLIWKRLILPAVSKDKSLFASAIFFIS